MNEESTLELARRWRRARDAALPGESAALPTEAHALELVLRRVFDHSLSLGKSFGRHHGVVLEQDDIVSLLPLLGVSCSERVARHGGAADWLERRPCEGATPALCAFHREAIDGFVLGLSDGEVFFRRHRSAGSGDARCLDVLFPAAEGGEPEKYGPIPEHMREGLDAAEQSLARFPAINVRFAGFSEGVLSYAVSGASAEVAVEKAVEKAVARRFVGVKTRCLAPRGVLGAES